VPECSSGVNYRMLSNPICACNCLYRISTELTFGKWLLCLLTRVFRFLIGPPLRSFFGIFVVTDADANNSEPPCSYPDSAHIQVWLSSVLGPGKRSYC
jgi:hypothetical protein